MTKKGYQAYLTYLALQRHFTSNYDYFTYHGKVKTSTAAYSKRNDIYSFEKLSRMFGSEEEILHFLLANFVSNKETWIKDMSKEVYQDWKVKIQKLPYIFEQDMRYIKEQGPAKIMSGDQPQIVKDIFGGKLQYESCIILNELYNFIDKLETNDTFIWPGIKEQLLNYRPFLINMIDKNSYTNIAKQILL